MKFLIASDLHGDAEALEKVLAAFEREGADRFLWLGDLLYHGPRNDLPPAYAPKSVIRLLNENAERMLAVRGNCDTEVDQMVLDFPILADYAVLCVGGKTILATHGHRFHAENLPKMKKGDILLHGHTHIPECRELGDVTIVNPGSAALPKAQSEKGYLVLDESGFVWKTLDGTEYRSFSFK